MWPVYDTQDVTVSRRCYEIICTLYIHSISENEVINNNKFPFLILFPKMPTFFEITANQTLFIVWSVLNLFTLGAGTNTELEKNSSTLLRIYMCQIFSD